MSYRIDDFANIIRAADGAMIPKDAQNRDYADYLAWVKAGNKAQEDSAEVKTAKARIYQIDRRLSELDQLCTRGMEDLLACLLSKYPALKLADMPFIKAYVDEKSALRAERKTL